MKTPAIVTKESLQQMLNDAALEKQVHIIGRALVALFQRQTESVRLVKLQNKKIKVPSQYQSPASPILLTQQNCKL
jgi:hypothetical protein